MNLPHQKQVKFRVRGSLSILTAYFLFSSLLFFVAPFHSLQAQNVLPSNVLPSDVLTSDAPQSEYGVTLAYGPQAELCATETNTPDSILLSPDQDWQATIESTTQPGSAFLLQPGNYLISEKLVMPAGTEAQPITLKPYNCAAVTLSGELRPASHNVIAGLTIDANGSGWAIRADGKRAHIEDLVIRNNLIWGGTGDAVRLMDDVSNVTVIGNHIDNRGEGHNIFVTSEDKLILPDQIFITQNLLTQRVTVTPTEDFLQIRDARHVSFTYNTCTEGNNMEQCVDIKSTVAPAIISHNFFDGEQMQLLGPGEDRSGGCMVIHESDDHAEQHIVEDNFFKNCKGGIIRFAMKEPTPGVPNEIGSALFRRNLLVNPPSSEASVAIGHAYDTILDHNTLINGQLKLGHTDPTRRPHSLLIKNNIFDHTLIEDLTTGGEWSYQCTNNLLYQTSGKGFVYSPCSNLVYDDPQWVNPSVDDYRLQASSPAIGRADDGSNLGSYPTQSEATPTPAPTSNFVPPTFTPVPTLDPSLVNHVYLPTLLRKK